MGSGPQEGIRRTKYAVNVQDGYGETIATGRLDRNATHVYQRFCAVDRVAEWLSVVSAVTVVDRDDQARPTRVEFCGTLKDSSITYALDYAYDDPGLRVQWSSGDGGIVKIAGSARFTPIDSDNCWLRYRLISERAHFLPKWDDELYQHRPAITVVLDFCDWVTAA